MITCKKCNTRNDDHRTYCKKCERRLDNLHNHNSNDDDDNSFSSIRNIAMGDMLGTGIPGGMDMDFTTPW